MTTSNNNTQRVPLSILGDLSIIKVGYKNLLDLGCMTRPELTQVKREIKLQARNLIPSDDPRYIAVSKLRLKWEGASKAITDILATIPHHESDDKADLIAECAMRKTWEHIK